MRVSFKSLLRSVTKECCRTVHHRVPAFVSELTDHSSGEGEPISGLDVTDRDITATLPASVEVPTNPTSYSKCRNPVLRGTDVTDFGDADFVADPFVVHKGGELHLFFEILNEDRTPNSAIGHAVSDNFGRTWQYNGVVLGTDVHISFPYVLKCDGQYYMLPEQDHPQQQRIDLFRAKDFPREWTEEGTLLAPDHRVQDSVVFRWRDRWWLLVGAGLFDTTYAYHSESLFGPWEPHADNPVVSERKRAAKPGGRPLVFDDRVVVFYQDCRKEYGHKVRAYEIETLTPQQYTDDELSTSPVLEGTGGVGWNASRMHHFDPLYVGDDRWLCAVDGDVGCPRQLSSLGFWSVGLYGAGW